MKKLLLVAVALLLFSLTPHVLAADSNGFVPLTDIPGLTSGGVADSQGGLTTFFNNLYKYLIGIAAILAIIEIIWAGFTIATNQDSVSEVMASKGRIYNAVLGLVLVLSPVLVFSIINPSILNLSLNLPPLKTQVGMSNGTGVQGVPAQVSDVAGCRATSGPNGAIVIQCAATDTATAVSKVGEYITTNCAGQRSDRYIPFLDSSACTNNTTNTTNGANGVSVSTQCTQYAIIGFCSPVFTAHFYSKAGAGVVVGGEATACTGSTWHLTYAANNNSVNLSGGMVLMGQGLGTPSPTCDQNTDPILASLIKKNGAGNYTCIDAPVYCRYTP